MSGDRVHDENAEIDVRSWYGHILVIAYGFGSRSWDPPVSALD
jgi:hypothetical protein